VDGADLAGVEPAAEADCCRVYLDGENGFRGVPPVDQIAAALTMGEHTPAARGSGGAAPVGWRGLLAVLPGLGAALLPVGTCPACWPAYAAFLGSIGLGFLFTENYLLPVTAAFLMLAVASLAYRSRSRHGYGPFGVGALAAIVALGGKFALASDPMLYAGLGMIVGASLWNAWPRKTAAGSCAACAPHAAQLTDATNTKEVAS